MSILAKPQWCTPPLLEGAESISALSWSWLQNGMQVLHFRPWVLTLKCALRSTAMGSVHTAMKSIHVGGQVLYRRYGGITVGRTWEGAS